MDASKKVALVVGAQGVIGRNLVDHLATLDDWDVVGLARRGATAKGRVQYIAVDLLDSADTLAKLRALDHVTHVFYAAYQDRPSWTELVAPNLAMLVNLLDAIEPAATGLQHVSLMQGYKCMAAILDPSRRRLAKTTLTSCRRNSCSISSAFSRHGKWASAGAGR